MVQLVRLEDKEDPSSFSLSPLSIPPFPRYNTLLFIMKDLLLGLLLSVLHLLPLLWPRQTTYSKNLYRL